MNVKRIMATSVALATTAGIVVGSIGAIGTASAGTKWTVSHNVGTVEAGKWPGPSLTSDGHKWW